MSKILLFMENDSVFLKRWSDILTGQGYLVIPVQTVEAATNVIDNQRIHLAICDIRMRNNDNPDDKSGLQFVLTEEYLAVQKLILTDYPHHQDTRDALIERSDGRKSAIDYVDKVEGPRSLLSKLDSAFANHVRINWDLSIRFTQPSSFTYLTNLIDPDIPSEWLTERASELEDLFRKLFFANEQITIGRVLRQGSGQIEVEVYAYGGNELKGQFVVTCGKKDLIRIERKHYKEGTPGDTSIGSTDLAAHKETMRYGLIAYRLMGGGELEEMETLPIYYHRHSAKEVKTMLNHLYTDSLYAWHKIEQVYVDNTGLKTLYLDWLGLDPDLEKASLGQKIKILCNHALRLVRTECSVKTLSFHLESRKATTFPNPLHLLYDDSLTIKQPILQGITHGQVNAESVLVDRSGLTWLIGFRHAEPGPLLRDFVHLEDALKTHFSQGMDLPASHALEQRLLDVSDLNSPIPTDDLSPDQTKLVETVMHIRHLAAERAGSELAPYLAGLLACALAYVNTFDTTVKYYSNRELTPYARSLLQAAMLSEKLTGSLPIPAVLPDQAYNSLWLDTENRVVWVEGKEIELTPQDYDLLHYLYERASYLCTRKMILAEALDDPSDPIHVASKLTNAIRRLRHKIEPDPKKPEYLKTLKGQGYKLVLKP